MHDDKKFETGDDFPGLPDDDEIGELQDDSTVVTVVQPPAADLPAQPRSNDVASAKPKAAQVVSKAEPEAETDSSVKKIAVVLDANAFIKRIPIRQVINPSLKTDDQFYEMYELYTLSEVVAEIKDAATRQYVENLPFNLTISPSSNLVDEQDLQLVEDFAKETGDLTYLSHVDKLVIAAGISLSRKKDEYDLVQAEPPSIEEFRPKRFQEYYEDDGADSSSDEDDDGDNEEQQQPPAEDDGFQVTSGKRNKGKPGVTQSAADPDDDFAPAQKRRGAKDAVASFASESAGQVSNAKLTKLQKKYEEAKKSLIESESEEENEENNQEAKKNESDLSGPEKTQAAADDQNGGKEAGQMEKVEEEDEDALDDEEDGGQWITSDNIHRHLGGAADSDFQQIADHDLVFQPHGAGGSSEQPEKPANTSGEAHNNTSKIKYVKFVTSDMAMQNVIIQLGFQLLTLDGMLLRRIRRWKLLCVGCGHINAETGRMFCVRCGGAFLQRVSVYVNANGKLTYFKNPRRKVNLRGLQYDIPKAKGGRGHHDLILREGDLQKGENRQLMKQMKRQKKSDLRSINDALDGNYWAGGQGSQVHGVSNLLYDDGAKGGKTTSQRVPEKLVVGFGRKNPNVARKRV